MTERLGDRSFRRTAEAEHMAIYDLNQVELNQLMQPNIDPSVRNAVLQFLFDGDTSSFGAGNRGPGNGNSNHGPHNGNNQNNDCPTHLQPHGPGDEVTIQISDGTDPL